jgi:hypothetical protein
MALKLCHPKTKLVKILEEARLYIETQCSSFSFGVLHHLKFGCLDSLGTGFE